MTRALVAAMLAVFVAGVTAGQQLQKINPDGLSQPQSYTHVVRAGNLVFIAGQVGADAAGTIAGPGMAAQLDRALTNMGIALKSQGLDFSHVAKITIYTTSVAEFRTDEAAAVRRRHFGDNRPASTLVQISQLASPDFKVEVEAIAVRP